MHSTWFITRPYWTLGEGGGGEQGALCTRATAAGTSPKRSSLQGRRQKGRRKKRKGRGNWGEKEREELFSSSLHFFVYATQARVPKKWNTHTHTQKHRLTIICVGGWVSWIKNHLHSKFKNSKEKFPTCEFYFYRWLICLLESALKQLHNHNSLVILMIMKQFLENLFIHSCRSFKTLFYFGLQSSV